MATAVMENMTARNKLKTYTRPGSTGNEKFEKPVILPELTDKNPVNHIWADARFASDIMAEHGLFFALLMPEELALKEKQEAMGFSQKFSELFSKIDSANIDENTSLAFVTEITDEMKRFIDYKHRQHEAQVSGNLRSLVWPLFFDHTRREAERWVSRLQNLSNGNSEFDRNEVVTFWSGIMNEHARFVAHLLDPDEYELIKTSMDASGVFQGLKKGGLPGVAAAAAKEPLMVTKSLIQNPEIDAVMSAAETILDFKTKAVRDIEKARIKSIIDPRLADHVRREALKFIDELKRAS